ncbi:MAG: hypothetical protein LBK61_11760 [Spirochaetaceae bacterium]|nr:hypothetical protein [Spirochaetaceae bacterium]
MIYGITMFILGYDENSVKQSRSAPAGGENPSGFHPFVKPFPDSCRESAVGRSAPAGSENPLGFHPFVKPFPNSCRESAGTGRIPSCGGCASPAGAQCRRMTVFCPPRTMPDWGGMNK